jgi:hypothetical protein
METEGQRNMRVAVESMDANREARTLKERLAKARTKEELTSIEDSAFFYAAKWPAHKERFHQIAADVANKQLPPNAAGRKPKYNAAEDARVFDLYQGQPERISIEHFRDENSAIKKAYPLPELRLLIDRERKRRAGEIKNRRRGKGCQ